MKPNLILSRLYKYGTVVQISWILNKIYIREKNSGEKILYCDVDLVDTHENNILDIWVDTYSEYFILNLFDFNDWH